MCDLAGLNENEILSAAFSPGSRFGAVKLKVVAMPEVFLPTGRIACFDPLVPPDSACLSLAVDPGRYAVDLAVAQFFAVDGTTVEDERVAFSRIKFADDLPAEWRVAAPLGGNLAALEPGEIFGYSVDSGTGCYSSPEFLEAVAVTPDYSSYSDGLLALLQSNYRHTWSSAEVAAFSLMSGNLVAFTAGYGDGFYPSWWGISSDGSPVCLVTNFGVFGEPAQAEG